MSKATVSRHLNARSDLLTPDISARVAAAIRDLGYRPSAAAQGLKHGRSRLVGLVVADVTNPYSVAVLHGAEATFREAGYMVLLFNAGNDGRREREAMAALADYQVEGFIVHAPGGEAFALDAAVHRGKPVVLVDRRAGGVEPFDLVGLDNAGAARAGVAHLLDAGYRQLLFVGEPARGFSSRQERLAAFESELARRPQAAGASFESHAGDPAALDAALRALLRRADGAPAAVLSANAVVTLRVAAAAARVGAALGGRARPARLRRDRMGAAGRPRHQHAGAADRRHRPLRRGLPARTHAGHGAAAAPGAAAGDADRARLDAAAVAAPPVRAPSRRRTAPAGGARRGGFSRA